MRHNVAARLSPLVARCTRRVASQCDILSQACLTSATSLPYFCHNSRQPIARVSCVPLRGSGCSRLVTGIEWQMSMRHIVAGLCLCCTTVGCAPARAGGSCIEDTVLHKCHSPLRGIGAARLRSCSPHVRALHPRPYSRGILNRIDFRSLHCSPYPWLSTRHMQHDARGGVT